jgi:hypothetical protein
MDRSGPGSRRLFLAGLMDWVSDRPPDGSAIAGAKLVAQGQAHIKTISVTGGAILGHRPLELDGLEPALEVSHRLGGTVWLQRGFTQLRHATGDEAATLAMSAVGWGRRGEVGMEEETFTGAGRPDPLAPPVRTTRVLASGAVAAGWR